MTTRRVSGMGVLWLALRPMLGTVTRVVTTDPVVALTFDDGPDPVYTPRLLEVLDRYHARATFFMVGEAAQGAPALVKQIAEAGHAIGNHTWDHASLPFLFGHERRAQLLDCQRALAPFGSRWFRPPFGHHTPGVHWQVRRLGFDVVGWSRTGKDWMGLNAHAIVGLLLERLQPGHVVLLHDRLYAFEDARVLDRHPTLEAVGTLLGHFESRYQFVTLPELLQHGRPWRQLWHRPVDLAYLNRVQTAHGRPRRYARLPRPSALERALLDSGIGR